MLWKHTLRERPKMQGAPKKKNVVNLDSVTDRQQTDRHHNNTSLIVFFREAKKSSKANSMNVCLTLVYDLFSKVTCLEQQGIHC